MTTEVGTETDVKKEPEKVQEVQQQTDQPDKTSDGAAPANADEHQVEIKTRDGTAVAATNFVILPYY